MAKSSPYRGVTLFRPTGKWRAQISAVGKTVSLGDHDTEEEAAHAFDRAAINKGGRKAKTNFPMSEYETEVTELTGLSQEDLVAMLRSRARKSTSHTSSYRGVSLLKQTGKWHAQINVGGKQVHLGFFLSEQLAAKAYDRAAINKSLHEGQKAATNFDMSTYRDEMKVLTAMKQDDFVAALADEERRKGLMDMLGQGFTLSGAQAVFGSSFMQPPGGKGSSTQAKAGRAHRELQALQRDISASLSVSTGKVSTRKRKLAESHLDAAAAAAVATTPAAAAATTPAAAAADAPGASRAASGADDQSANASLTSRPSDTGGQGASHNKDRNQAPVRSRRRAPQRSAKTGADKQVATTKSALLVTRASEERHRDGSMEAANPPATAVASSGAGADVDKRPGMGSGHPHLPEGQDQPGAKAATIQPMAGKTRSHAQRDVAQATAALIKMEDTLAAEAHAQERVPAGQAGADENAAESERDRRLLARQMCSTGPKVRVNKDLPAATPFLLAEAQQAGQSSIRAPAAKEPLPPAAASAATGKAPKRAKRTKAPEAAATGLAPKSSDAPSEAAGSQQVTASGSAKKPAEAVQATPAVASAAAKADALPHSNGGSAASKGAVSAGAAGSKAQPSAADNTVAVGTTDQSAAAAAAAADTSASAGEPPAAPAASLTLLSAQAASKAAQNSAAGQPVSQQGAPGSAPAGAASSQLEQPAGAPGKRTASAAGAVPYGPGEFDRPAGAALLSSNLPAATAPAEANASKAAQQEGSKPASTSQEVGRNISPSSPGKMHQPTVPAETGIVSAPADSMNHQVQDVARLGPDFDPESSPTLVADVKVSQQGDAQLASLPTPSNTPTDPHTLPFSTTHATPPTDPGLKPSQALPTSVSSSPFATQPASQELQSLPTSKAALTGSIGQQAINSVSQGAVPGTASSGAAVPGIAAVPKISTHRGGAPGLSSGSQGYTGPPVWANISSSVRPALDAGNATGSAASTKPHAAVPGLTNGRSASGLATAGGLPTAVGRRPEAANAAAGLVLPTKSMTASSAIAAAARANAAAASAIAESGSSLCRPSSGFAHDDGCHASGVMHPTPPAKSPAGQLPTAPAASKAGAIPAGMAGTGSARTGSSGAEQHQAPSASQAASQAMFMTQQQQRLNGTAMMTAMHQSGSGLTSAQGNTEAAQAAAPQAASGPLRLSNPSMPAPAQQIADSSRYGSMQGSGPFLNPNFALPSGPAPFRSSSNPSSRAGPPANPNSYVPSSSAANPNSMLGFAAGSNPMYPRSSMPLAPGSHFSGPGLSISVPNPSSSKPLGPQPSGNPLSPSYRPQGLHATASETGTVYQSLGQGSSQIPWPHAKSPYRGGPSQPQPTPHAHPSLPAGAQVTPTASRAQQQPQLAAQASMAMEMNMQALQSRGLTNAHTIVPGMLPSSLPRSSNTAWQVGLAAGLAATANLRPPNPSVGHQAATTAAAARAAAAFQASRAMAKSQQSPLLQQGSVNAGTPAATDGSNLVGPSTTSSSGFTLPASTAISNRPLITSGIDTNFGASAKAAESAPGFGTGTLAAASSMAPPAASGAPPAATAVATAGSAGGHLQGSHPHIASHQAFARQGLRASLPTAVATSANPPGHLPTGAGLTAPAPISTALPGRPVPQPAVATSYSAAGPTAYSAEAQALYRARAQAQPPFNAQPRPYAAQSQALGALPQSQYVSLSQPPYNVQTHTPYIAPSQLPYVAQSQPGYKPQLQPPPAYSAQSQAQYSTAATAQQRYAATASQRYAAAAPQLAQPRPALRPPLNVEHFTFGKLAPQPKNAIDIIAEDAVLPTFPMKKKKPKKRKFAGLEVFAAEVHRHKSRMQESKRNVLQCQFVKKSPIGRPPKDLRPRMPSAARQAEQQLAKASSVTSLAPKPKGKAAKGTKGKAAAAKGRKGGTPKKGNRVVWDSVPQKRRSGDRAGGPSAGRQFASAARLHQEHTGNTGMDQLLGALGPELEAHEAEEGSDSDDDAVSGTDQGGPHRASAPRPGREGVSVKRAKGGKTVARASSAAARGRGRGRGSKEALTGRGGKGHKRAASSSPDRGPVRHNRRKTQAPSRAS